MRRAKIVATLGPATSSYENIRAIIEAGVDVARMNLSHGNYDVHEEVYENVRKAADDSGRAVAVLVDLQGPKIRLGRFADGPHELAVGDIFTITTEDVLGTKEIVATTLKGLPEDVKPGDFLLIDDGKVARRGRRDRRRRRHDRGHRRRHGVQQQGHQPARRRGQRAGADRKGRGRPALGPRARRRHRRPVVRAQRRRHRARARDHGRGGPPGAGHRQDREAAGGGRARGDHRRVRRASWWPAATSAWSCRSRRCRSCRSAPSNWPAAGPSRSSWPPRCSSR